MMKTVKSIDAVLGMLAHLDHVPGQIHWTSHAAVLGAEVVWVVVLHLGHIW